MWQTIAASETDANSPLNQTLLDKIRGNLDHLRGIGATMKFVNARFTNTDPSADFILDQEQDWRDRFIAVLGQVYQGTNNDCDAVVLGGNRDYKIGSIYTATLLNLHQAQLDGWFYSAAGNTARAGDPHYWTEDASGDPDIYLWVNSSNGNLMFSSVTSRPSDSRNLVCHLRLTWSEDQGAH